MEIITVIACHPISGLVTMISRQTPWWLGVKGHDQSVMQMGSEITMIGCSVSAGLSIQCPSVNIHNCRARSIYIWSSSAYSSSKCHNRVLSFKSVCCHTICNKCRTGMEILQLSDLGFSGARGTNPKDWGAKLESGHFPWKQQAHRGWGTPYVPSKSTSCNLKFQHSSDQ